MDGIGQRLSAYRAPAPDAGGLLERDGEVFMNRKRVLNLKLKGYHQPKGKLDGKGSPGKDGKKGKERGKGKGGEKGPESIGTTNKQKVANGLRTR